MVQLNYRIPRTTPNLLSIAITPFVSCLVLQMVPTCVRGRVDTGYSVVSPLVQCNCHSINCAQAQQSLHSRWNFISTFTEFTWPWRWPTVMRSYPYLRGVARPTGLAGGNFLPYFVATGAPVRFDSTHSSDDLGWVVRRPVWLMLMCFSVTFQTTLEKLEMQTETSMKLMTQPDKQQVRRSEKRTTLLNKNAICPFWWRFERVVRTMSNPQGKLSKNVPVRLGVRFQVFCLFVLLLLLLYFFSVWNIIL